MSWDEGDIGLEVVRWDCGWGLVGDAQEADLGGEEINCGGFFAAGGLKFGREYGIIQDIFNS